MEHINTLSSRGYRTLSTPTGSELATRSLYGAVDLKKKLPISESKQESNETWPIVKMTKGLPDPSEKYDIVLQGHTDEGVQPQIGYVLYLLFLFHLSVKCHRIRAFGKAYLGLREYF